MNNKTWIDALVVIVAAAILITAMVRPSSEGNLLAGTAIGILASYAGSANTSRRDPPTPSLPTPPASGATGGIVAFVAAILHGVQRGLHI